MRADSSSKSRVKAALRGMQLRVRVIPAAGCCLASLRALTVGVSLCLRFKLSGWDMLSRRQNCSFSSKKKVPTVKNRPASFLHGKPFVCYCPTFLLLPCSQQPVCSPADRSGRYPASTLSYARGGWVITTSKGRDLFTNHTHYLILISNIWFTVKSHRGEEVLSHRPKTL